MALPLSVTVGLVTIVGVDGGGVGGRGVVGECAMQREGGEGGGR